MLKTVAHSDYCFSAPYKYNYNDSNAVDEGDDTLAYLLPVHVHFVLPCGDVLMQLHFSRCKNYSTESPKTTVNLQLTIVSALL